MAIINREKFHEVRADGTLRALSFDYNDQTNRVTTFHATNTSSVPLNVQAVELSNGLPTGITALRTFPPFSGVTTFVLTNELQMFVNSKGWLDGVDWNIW